MALGELSMRSWLVILSAAPVSSCGTDSTVSDTEASRFSPSAIIRTGVGKIKQFGQITEAVILEEIGNTALRKRHRHMSTKLQLLENNLFEYKDKLHNMSERGKRAVVAS